MKKALTVVGIVAGVFLIISGILLYHHWANRLQGNWFQRMKGSVGVVYDGEYSLNLSLFSFNEAPDFLKDPSKLSLDNQEVVISDISLDQIYDEKDLVIYSVTISVKMKKDGDYTVKTLCYNDGTNNRNYQLGEITFVNRMNKDIFLEHGCDSEIRDGIATYTISGKNEKPFVIKDLILANDNDVSFEYDKNVEFKPGQDIQYNIRMDYHRDFGDVYLVQPIFIIETNTDSEEGLFSPGIVEMDRDEMTYVDIKEYVIR